MLTCHDFYAFKAKLQHCTQHSRPWQTVPKCTLNALKARLRALYLQGLPVKDKGEAALVLPLRNGRGQVLHGRRQPLACLARLQGALQVPVGIPALQPHHKGFCMLTLKYRLVRTTTCT